MKHGDISNRVSLSFGIMCEDNLIKYKDNTIKDKFLNRLFGKSKRAEIDENTRSVMEYIYRNTEYTVDLIVQDANYLELKPILADLPYNRVVIYSKLSQVTARLLTGDLSYVVDNNDERRSLLNSSYAMTLEEFSSMLKRSILR